MTSARVALVCHSATPCEAVRRIEVQVRRMVSDVLAFSYVLEGDIAALSIPAESAPRRADKLWQHTCFEAFAAAMDTTAYHEFNFSPSTEWAIYRFGVYREGMSAPAQAETPAIAVQRRANQLLLTASIDLAPLSELRGGVGIRLALSAVIEDVQHRLSYWALAHPSERPDFHHDAGFVLELPAASDSARA